MFNLDSLCFTKENQFFDRKSARIKPRDILKHLVAFANANGGVLVIGIEDNGDISGFGINGAHPLEAFKEIALVELRKTPIIAIYEEIAVINKQQQADKILVISINVSTDRIIESYDGRVYLRQADKSIELNYEQITQLSYDRGQRFFEDEVLEDATFEDIDLSLIEEYKLQMNLPDLSMENLFNARNLMRNGKLTHAAILLFGNNPTKFLPQARLRFIKYDGTQAQVGKQLNIVKDRTFDGAIPDIIHKAKAFISSQLREFQYLDDDGRFKIMPEYPEFAWFEGIVNALVHRNYSFRGDYIRVIMFDDRLEIHSPGKLPNIVTLENMSYKRYSRNPRIARILTEFGWVREMNEGVKRIYSEMESFFLNEPIYMATNDSVALTLENNILNRSLRINDNIEALISSELFKALDHYDKKIAHYLYVNQKITVKEAAILLDKSKRFTGERLKKLAELNVLKWQGTSAKDPTQYYTLNI
ncbi:ATP-dependent DNA helicase RecG [Pasteurellaceae bacterium RH1A]|nr:ATP-dependent DNA helicase RecG [Pasteurellaceae bacterium RH1A]